MDLQPYVDSPSFSVTFAALATLLLGTYGKKNCMKEEVRTSVSMPTGLGMWSWNPWRRCSNAVFTVRRLLRRFLYFHLGWLLQTLWLIFYRRIALGYTSGVLCRTCRCAILPWFGVEYIVFFGLLGFSPEFDVSSLCQECRMLRRSSLADVVNRDRGTVDSVS